MLCMFMNTVPEDLREPGKPLSVSMIAHYSHFSALTPALPSTSREYAEDAINILEELLPPNHLRLSSAKRVKALILEEIALDLQSNMLGMYVVD